MAAPLALDGRDMRIKYAEASQRRMYTHIAVTTIVCHLHGIPAVLVDEGGLVVYVARSPHSVYPPSPLVILHSP